MKSAIKNAGMWYAERHVVWFLVGLLGLNSITIPVPYFGIVSIPASLWVLYLRYWVEEEL